MKIIVPWKKSSIAAYLDKESRKYHSSQSFRERDIFAFQFFKPALKLLLCERKKMLPAPIHVKHMENVSSILSLMNLIAYLTTPISYNNINNSFSALKITMFHYVVIEYKCSNLH